MTILSSRVKKAQLWLGHFEHCYLTELDYRFGFLFDEWKDHEAYFDVSAWIVMFLHK